MHLALAAVIAALVLAVAGGGRALASRQPGPSRRRRRECDRRGRHDTDRGHGGAQSRVHGSGRLVARRARASTSRARPPQPGHRATGGRPDRRGDGPLPDGGRRRTGGALRPWFRARPRGPIRRGRARAGGVHEPGAGWRAGAARLVPARPGPGRARPTLRRGACVPRHDPDGARQSRRTPRAGGRSDRAGTPGRCPAALSRSTGAGAGQPRNPARPRPGPVCQWPRRGGDPRSSKRQ